MSSNSDPSCQVCGGIRSQPVEGQATTLGVPVVDRQVAPPSGQSTIAEQGAGERIAAGSPTAPLPGGRSFDGRGVSVPPHSPSTVPPSPERKSHNRSIVAVAGILVVGLAVGIGAAVARSGDSASEPSVATAESPAPSDISRIDDNEDDDVPVVTTTQPPATTQPIPDEVQEPVVTAPPTTDSPPTTEPRSAPSFSTGYTARYVEDPDHLVRLAIPDHFVEHERFDPYTGFGEWSGDGVTLTYEVYSSATVDQLAHRESELLQLHEVTYNPAHGDNWHADGRYVVAARAQEGHYFYERAKLRCGDLVLYRLEWNGARIDPVADAIANRLYDDDPSLDAMGGVHPTC